MTWKVLIVHARGEEVLAEQLAGPIREAGYDVFSEATMLVGQSLVGETERVLETGGPVVLCGSSAAAGGKWARRLIHAARQSNAGVRVFIVEMDADADTEPLALGDKVARYWENVRPRSRTSLCRCGGSTLLAVTRVMEARIAPLPIGIAIGKGSWRSFAGYVSR